MYAMIVGTFIFQQISIIVQYKIWHIEALHFYKSEIYMYFES